MKSAMWYIAGLLFAISVKPSLHYLRDEFGLWGWGAGMLMCVIALAGWAWWRIKLDRTAASDEGKKSG
jgi:hypothetical protein